MAEYSYELRNPRAVFKKDGVEDEKTKAARILALCADKPIRKITKTEDIYGENPYQTPPPTGGLTQESKRRQQKLLKALQKGPMPLCDLDLLIGKKDRARDLLKALEADGLAERADEVQVRNGIRRSVVMWRLTDAT